jgi:ABC-type multidrug transport system fused ATPase/permease subunit
MLENGRIIETGKHEALVAIDGTYARFYRTQFGSGEDTRPVGGGTP